MYWTQSDKTAARGASFKRLISLEVLRDLTTEFSYKILINTDTMIPDIKTHAKLKLIQKLTSNAYFDLFLEFNINFIYERNKLCFCTFLIYAHRWTTETTNKN